MNDPTKWRPTMRLRWVTRRRLKMEIEGYSVDPNLTVDSTVLQQWHGPELPAYLRDDSVGEWRDVPVGVEAP
jgi:hypothetical protein